MKVTNKRDQSTQNKEGTIAIDYSASAIGEHRLVLVKELIPAKEYHNQKYKVKELSGRTRCVHRGSLKVLFRAPRGTKNLTEFIKLHPRKIVKKLLHKLSVSSSYYSR